MKKKHVELFKELLETRPVSDFYKKQQETRNDLETTRPNVSKKIRNDCTKTQNRDQTIFYYVSYKTGLRVENLN